MFLIEGGQFYVKPYSCLSNQRIQDAEIVTQVIRSEVVEGLPTTGLAGPV